MRPTKRNAAFMFVAACAVIAVSVLVWRAKAQTVISAGYDQFSTPANAVTQDSLSLPEGALTDGNGYASVAFTQTVTFEGGAAVAGYTGDTVIERTQNVTVPGSTPLQVIGINLASVGTIPISFEDGTSANYQVSVSQSQSTASTGTMSFASDGTFTNSLSVNVEYTFTASGEPTATYDAAANGIAAIAFTSSGTWDANGGSSAVDIQRRLGDDATTTGTGGGGGGSGSSSSAVSVTIVPQTEQAALAAHGVGPAPSPSPTPTATPVGGCGDVVVDPRTNAVTHPCDDNKKKGDPKK